MLTLQEVYFTCTSILHSHFRVCCRAPLAWPPELQKLLLSVLESRGTGEPRRVSLYYWHGQPITFRNCFTCKNMLNIKHAALSRSCYQCKLHTALERLYSHETRLKATSQAYVAAEWTWTWHRHVARSGAEGAHRGPQYSLLVLVESLAFRHGGLTQ